MASTLPDTLDALAQRLTQAAKDLRYGHLSLENDTFQRMSLIKAGNDLIEAVSQPKDKAIQWIPPFTHIAAVRLFINWKAFEKIPTDDGAAISYTELATSLAADLSLISQIPASILLVATPS
jgi:hypothetical protein